MSLTIPGALADYLTGQTITDTTTVTTLDAARRGRGRTLVIEPTSTRVLHVISAYAEAILENRKLHTTAEVRAARLWIQRAGHAPAPVAKQAPTTVRDEPSNWWTIMGPGTGEEITRVYGETWQDMTPRAEALPEVRAVIRQHNGFSRRRLSMSELTPAQRTMQAEATVTAPEQTSVPATLTEWERDLLAADTNPTPRYTTADENVAADMYDDAERQLADIPTAADRAAAELESRQMAELITEAEATDGTWRGEWIGARDDTTLFALPGAEQGSLFA
ncbi:hypothetical protein [Streptomyces salyersiae]|uniref:Uncharacterized protein n=1 Tax=Streptomyces salyersiae TaxID=3075530 RepID=A0ABU2RVD9_9ACTN|nr:hypothetical protein [Streptomyces sp. DSM 41770]MDT0432789.1 hypothetical protein [Streptomyces sp. DSM 41770]